MSAYTSAVTTGNWNSSSSWTGGSTYPGSGDTATIATGNTITIPDGFTATVGLTGQPTGTTACTVNGALVIGNGASGQLNLQGDLVIAGTTTPFTMNAGSQIRFVPANAQAIKVNFSANNHGCAGSINGSSSHGCTILTDPTALTGGGMTGYFSNGGTLALGVNVCTYCTFTQINNSGSGNVALTINLNNGGSTNTYNGTCTNNSFSYCGTVSVSAGYNQGNVNYNYNIHANTVSAATYPLKVTYSYALSTGSRNFIGNTFDLPVYIAYPFQCTINYNAFTGQQIITDNSSKWASLSGNFFADSGGAVNPTITAIGDVKDNYFLKTASGNLHYITGPSTLNYGPTIDSNIFESTSGNGKCYLPGNPSASGQTHTVTRNIVLPVQGASNTGAGAIVDLLAGSNQPDLVCEHNTICAGVNAALWMSDSVAEPTGVITSYRANLVWCASKGAQSYKGCMINNPTTGAYVDEGSVAAMNYNTSWNCNTDEPGDGVAGSYPGAGTVHTITNATSDGGLIQIQTNSAHGLTTGNKVYIEGVVGTTEANNTGLSQWTVTVIGGGGHTVDLQSSTFTNTYVSGGRLCTTYPFAGNGYQAHFSAGFAGANDVPDQSPAFIASTRNLGAWAVYEGQASGGASYATQVAAAIAYLSTNPATLIPSLLSWVRAGFVPTNSALEAASYPSDPMTVDANGNAWLGSGPDIGAMAYAPPPTPTTGTGAAALGALVAAGSGSFMVTASGAAALGAFVAAGVGTALSPPGSTGTGAATWSALVAAGIGSASAGAGSTTGTGAAALATLTASGIGLFSTAGVGAASLGAIYAIGVGIGSGGAPLFLPYQFSTTLIPAALDTSDPFGIDPGQTTLITTGLDTGP